MYALDAPSTLCWTWLTRAQWEDAQKARLIILHIQRDEAEQQSKPSISQITEAGILGKIGLNAAGVGVCLNAIRAHGVNFSALPVHLALRVAMDTNLRDKAVARLRSLGVAAAAHILIADIAGATSVESSALDLVKLEMKKGQIAHANHFLAKHAIGVRDAVIFPDSWARMDRITSLLSNAANKANDGPEGLRMVEKMLEDQEGFPTAINRQSSPDNPSSTLFSIIMDLRTKMAFVKLGRPTECEATFLLRPANL